MIFDYLRIHSEGPAILPPQKFLNLYEYLPRFNNKFRNKYTRGFWGGRDERLRIRFRGTSIAMAVGVISDTSSRCRLAARSEEQKRIQIFNIQDSCIIMRLEQHCLIRIDSIKGFKSFYLTYVNIIGDQDIAQRHAHRAS